MKNLRAGFTSCIAGVLGACVTAALLAQSDYVVGPQDVLAITVWDQTDLSGKYTVETDGTFTFPLIGRVTAGGLTLRSVEEELKKRLAAGFFRNPQVSVAVDQYRSQQIFIIGEVRNPGPVALAGEMTLIEALARAGSTTPSAGSEALVVRAPTGSQRSGPTLPNQQDPNSVTRVDLRDLQSGALSQNVNLRDGDTVFVPRAATIFVYGHVKNPGEYAIKRDTTVRQALSLAGGATDRGSDGRIKIVRLVEGKEKEIDAKLNDVVQSGDTVMVRERLF